MTEHNEQPRAPEAPPKYATPFEMAVYEYEKKAFKHYKAVSAGAPPNESEEARKKRISEWNDTKEHLRKERLRLTSLAGLEAEIAEYRKQMISKGPMEMLEEKHHPTKDLVKNLVANHEPRPSAVHVAHHLVPGKGRWRQTEVLDVRLRMHTFGLGINFSENGAWLPDKKEDAPHPVTPKAPAHKDIHRYNYETWIVHSFPPTIDKNAFWTRLSIIKSELLTGEYPQKIVEPKDPDWKP